MKTQAGLVVIMVILSLAANFISQIEREELEIYVEKPGVVVLPRIERQYEFGWPIHPEDYVALSSPYGKRDLNETGGYGDDFHDGVDMYGTWRARIVSVADGTVIEHFPPPNGYYRGHPVLGGYLVVQHDQDTRSHYAHLSRTYVHEGDVVVEGQVIGRQGKSGKTASAHLHFALEIDGGLANPLRYLREELK